MRKEEKVFEGINYDAHIKEVKAYEVDYGDGHPRLIKERALAEIGVEELYYSKALRKFFGDYSILCGAELDNIIDLLCDPLHRRELCEILAKYTHEVLLK